MRDHTRTHTHTSTNTKISFSRTHSRTHPRPSHRQALTHTHTHRQALKGFKGEQKIAAKNEKKSLQRVREAYMRAGLAFTPRVDCDAWPPPPPPPRDVGVSVQGGDDAGRMDVQ